MQDFRNVTSQNINNQGVQRLKRDPATPLMSNEFAGVQGPLKQPKQGFIEARLNKDNFWNLMFASAMVVGFFAVGFIPSLIILAIIVAKLNKITFNEDKQFLNSQGEDITARIPNTLVWPIVFTIVATVLTGNIFDNHGKNLPDGLSSFVIISVFFFSFVWYFILINCPISVLFSLDVWRQKRTAFDINDLHHQQRVRASFDSSAEALSPTRSYLGHNIYHNR